MPRMSVAGHLKIICFPSKKTLSISFKKISDNDRFQGFIRRLGDLLRWLGDELNLNLPAASQPTYSITYDWVTNLL